MALATVKGGYFGDVSVNYDPVSGKNPLRRSIAQRFDKNGLRSTQEIGLEITGAAAGATASASYSRVKAGEVSGAFQSELGGKRTIETKSDINRVTVAGDITDFDSKILELDSTPTYVANKDGNPRGYPGG
ncbi:MAG: hypothetical protein MN733_03430 [Nitrososphaera sp.]|nr:hypothetical protein [Nitrososphaera sp.]